MLRRTLPAVAWIAGALAGTLVVAAAPPDLRLEWLGPGSASDEGPPVHGRPGEEVRLDYRLMNVGARPAAAVELTTHTTLGPAGAPVELRPGPDSGEEYRRSVELELTIGLREVCIEARLRSDADDEPRDPTPDDNRICREVEIARSAATPSPRRPFPRRPPPPESNPPSPALVALPESSS